MSRVRGALPLFLVTAIGIFNGVWVFGPAFKEQQEKKQQAINAGAEQKLGETKAQVISTIDGNASIAVDPRSPKGPPTSQNRGGTV